MANININITEDNLMEWMHSVGYFLPRTEIEQTRFEKLHSQINHSINEESVNPFAILNGTLKPKAVKPFEDPKTEEEISNLKMAARKSQGLPDEILKKIKMNQSKNDKPGDTENESRNFKIN